MAARDLLSSAPENGQRRICLFGVLFVGAFGSLWFLERDAIGYLTLDREYYTGYYWPRRRRCCAGGLCAAPEGKAA